MKGIIIGAGIAGLSTAIALKSKGIDVDIYEAAAQLRPMGAGILIPPNALAILDRYNLSHKITSIGHAITSFQILDHQGNVISTSPSTYTNNGRQYKTIAIHRGDLQKILLSALNCEKIHLGYQCHKVEHVHGGSTVTFTNGQQRKGKFVIGADGLKSKVRQSIMPNSTFRSAKQLCWRGVATIELSEKWYAQLSEFWGEGLRFGFVQIATNQVYWFATAAHHISDGIESDNIHNGLLRMFSNYNKLIHEIIEKTPQNLIIESDIYDLKPMKNWFLNHVILIGDAAHAVTPNLGQGGAQAIEDSYVIAEKMSYHNDLVSAFEAFQLARMSKVNNILKMSWKIGKITNVSNPWLCFLRNQLLRGISPFMSKRQSEILYKL